MFNLLFKKQKDKLWRFRGGIYPSEMKQVTSGIPLRSLPLPNLLIIPLQQHLGAPGELSVQVGQYVLKGEPLTRGFGRALPVHAPTSGVISDISPQVTAHPSGLATMAISLIPDHKDIWCTHYPLADFTRVSREQLFAIIEQAGIAGLGGAGFPSATKLQHAKQIHTVIINAAECEPCITADDRLMQEYADEIITGCEILRHLLQPQQVFIGIEDNKPQAITALKQAIKGHSLLYLRIIPTKYPSGGARQLTKILTGMEIPIGQHSVSIGVLMQNIATVYAIKRAIVNGEPLIERVVTLTGELMRYPGNVWARIGTPVKHLLEAGGWITQATSHLVIMGGPLTGFTLPHVNVPIIKTSNAIVTVTNNEFVPPGREQACIRCAQCADVCPAGLLPQQLYWFSRGQQHEKARQYHLFDCIECGACAYVCPSRIPLVHYYRQQKAIICEQDQEKIRATEAKQRFEARQARLSREKQAREHHHQQAVRQPSSQHQHEIQAATVRIEQRQHAGERAGSFSTVAPSSENLVVYRTETEKLLPLQKAFIKNEAVSSTPLSVTQSPIDPRKAAVAAAIARAKARKAQQQLEYQSKLLKSPRLLFDDQQDRTQALKDKTLSNQDQNNTHLSLTDHEE